MKILVIGANGRVGQKLVEYLSNNNHEVLAGSRHPEESDKSKNGRLQESSEHRMFLKDFSW